MAWHIEILLNAALVIYLWWKPDGRPRFEAWLACRLIFDAVQLVTERAGHLQLATNAWYLGILAGTPLLFLALREAVAYPRRWHREILFGWVALSMGAAWIRFFPYTGRAVLLVDATGFCCWIAEKALSKSPSR